MERFGEPPPRGRRAGLDPLERRAAGRRWPLQPRLDEGGRRRPCCSRGVGGHRRGADAPASTLATGSRYAAALETCATTRPMRFWC